MPQRKIAKSMKEAEQITNDQMCEYETYKYGYNQALDDCVLAVSQKLAELDEKIQELYHHEAENFTLRKRLKEITQKPDVEKIDSIIRDSDYSYHIDDTEFADVIKDRKDLALTIKEYLTKEAV